VTATRRRKKLRLLRVPTAKRAASVPTAKRAQTSARAAKRRTLRRRTDRRRSRDERASNGRAAGVGKSARLQAAGRARQLGTAVGTGLRRLGPARVLVAVALALALGGGWLWFRDSSVVSVTRVTVTGVRGPGAGRIRAALIAAARGMTTLDVQVGRLHTAVQPFPAVRALQVSTQFPHGLRIHVIEQLPVAVLAAAGHRLAVSADGTALRDLRPPRALPLIAVRALPVGPRLTGRVEGQALAVLVGAPRQLRAHIGSVSENATHGIIVHLRHGPSLYFGSVAQLQAKWIAVTAVLANPGSAGAVYIDVTDPHRPAAG
jgi:cell division protein FtsQ